MKIIPTTGRVVLYFPSEEDRMEGMDVLTEAPCTALVAFVHSDTSINLVVFDHCGQEFQRHKVPINIERFTGLPRAEWMPYQVGKAAKHEAVPLAPIGRTIGIDHSPPASVAAGRAS
ncbi:hypothetical protein ONR75_15795 [Rhodopseudomonas sp. P2A-2r]|uniref:hypothetical protein n=1 Tax=Rhodopseudomonas sp. P2A-2r TaxID=2991972 RepID=UPI002234D69C|nr:hypothetical protein [Rhodopseudomonas sp. P2A-2r]UZE51894.1 hypothetical protein ONR75_15795 [Rhodopseudomonas sp. P2A-2r]